MHHARTALPQYQETTSLVKTFFHNQIIYSSLSSSSDSPAIYILYPHMTGALYMSLMELRVAEEAGLYREIFKLRDRE